MLEKRALGNGIIVMINGLPQESNNESVSLNKKRKLVKMLNVFARLTALFYHILYIYAAFPGYSNHLIAGRWC